MRSFHFSVGNSNKGPVGMCARIVAESPEAAVARLREMLPESWDTDNQYDLTPEGMDRKDEYVATYFNPDNITVADIDFEDCLGDANDGPGGVGSPVCDSEWATATSLEAHLAEVHGTTYDAALASAD